MSKTSDRGTVLLTEESAEVRGQRRRLLVTTPNPARRRGEPLDYLVAFAIPLPTHAARLCLTYVPGKLVLVPDALPRYLDALAPDAGLPLEALAQIVLEDVNDVLVPRWLQVTIGSDASAPDRPAHRVLVEDREPYWDNPALLARVGTS